jgi:hypothetical protein
LLESYFLKNKATNLLGLKNEKLAYQRNKTTKQRGNSDFEFVKLIECVVVILVYKQQNDRPNPHDSALVCFEKELLILKSHAELKYRYEDNNGLARGNSRRICGGVGYVKSKKQMNKN